MEPGKTIYYHASQVAGLNILEPRVSNHGVPLIYFSKKRENVLVYLSNAVEKYCRETGFAYDGPWMKWGPYGFEKDGRQRIEEYYPNMLQKTYQGVSGYVYQATAVHDSGFELQIPDAVTSSEPVRISGAEWIADAYEAILEAEKKGLLVIERYEQLSDKKKEWVQRTIRQEYEEATEHPEYRHFLQGNFGI